MLIVLSIVISGFLAMVLDAFEITKAAAAHWSIGAIGMLIGFMLEHSYGICRYYGL